MTFNDIYTNERWIQVRELYEAGHLAMREGNVDALERAAARLHNLSDEVINRLHDLGARK